MRFALCAILLAMITNSPRSSAAVDEARLQEIAYSKAWLRLVHYMPVGSGYKSELDGKGFYFAADGRTNPLAELKASIEGLKKSDPIGQLKLHPQCSFPER